MTRSVPHPARPARFGAVPRRDDETPSRQIDDRWLRALYLDLFGRPPSGEDRERWVGESVSDFLVYALGTKAAWKYWFDEQLYYFMLIDRFRPVGTTLDEIPGLLKERRLSARDALHRIALSTSFDLRNPGADTFVTVVMEQFCGIRVQESRRELEIGKTAYDGGSGLFLGERASSQSDVVSIAATHQRAAQHLVAREYERITRKEAGRSIVRKAGRELHKKPAKFPDHFASWFLTDDYAERVANGAPLTNRVWIRCIFHDLGGAPPTDADVESLRSALDGLGDPAPLRSAIVRMLLDADGTRPPRGPQVLDPRAWTRDTFLRLLGREPDVTEAKAFSEIVRTDPDGPELVLYTLLTSEEYDRP